MGNNILLYTSAEMVDRGMAVYENDQVKSCTQVDAFRYEGEVQGSSKKPYQVKVDVFDFDHSSCTCPYAKGSYHICKHEIAMYCKIFPTKYEEMKRYMDERTEEVQERDNEEYEKIVKEVKAMSLEQLQTYVINTKWESHLSWEEEYEDEEDDYYRYR